MEKANQSWIKCEQSVKENCSLKNQCGCEEDAYYLEGSECDKFAQHVHARTQVKGLAVKVTLDTESFEKALSAFKEKHPDFVEVVRCKECAVPHNKWTGCPKMNGTVMPHDGFCSYGKRKEG